MDLENLIYSARGLDFYLELRVLTDLLRGATRACVLHAVYSGQPDDASPRRDELEDLGWRVHINSIGTNSDSLILWKAGSLLTRSQADCVLLGSGDGDLVETLAHCVKQHLDKPRDVFTLSLPGSTSQRLNALHNPLISQNVEIGRDCLTPFSYVGGFHNAPIHA